MVENRGTARVASGHRCSCGQPEGDDDEGKPADPRRRREDVSYVRHDRQRSRRSGVPGERRCESEAGGEQSGACARGRAYLFACSAEKEHHGEQPDRQDGTDQLDRSKTRSRNRRHVAPRECIAQAVSRRFRAVHGEPEQRAGGERHGGHGENPVEAQTHALGSAAKRVQERRDAADAEEEEGELEEPTAAVEQFERQR